MTQGVLEASSDETAAANAPAALRESKDLSWPRGRQGKSGGSQASAEFDSGIR